MTPASWAAERAEQTGVKISSTSAGAKRPRRSNMLRRFSPETSSMTM